MPHPDREYGLQVEVARLTRALEEAQTDAANLRFVNDKVRKTCAAANARAEELSRIALGYDKERCNLQEALAAARRECDLLRAALRNDGNGSWWMCGNCDGWMIPDGGDDQCHCDYGAAARLALSAPAAAAGEEGK